MPDRRRLIDSNICVYLLEGASEPLRRRVAEHFPGELLTSSVVYAEVGIGIDRTNDNIRVGFERLFDQIVVLPFDRAAAERYWSLQFRRGKFDRLIAAHALALDVTIVTANPRDFANIPGLEVEDWTR